jgi:3-hydroxyacyl-CoA dehydrogenase/enoyl-CoA hydratase/3-hydroxybutyryl-CoA epimerase
VSAPTPALTWQRDEQGLMLATLDVPGEKVNTLGRALMGEFEALIGAVEGDGQVRALVLRSGKPDNFIAGADIKDLRGVKSALEAETLSRGAQALLDRLAALHVPVVAAIHGACLGGGLEVALACRYRVASSDAKTALGLPEVMLGLIPGAGGTQRLPRLIGLAQALDLILTGRTLKATRALKVGLVDEVVPPALLDLAARRAALALAEGRLHGRASQAALGDRALRTLMLAKARRDVLAKSGGHYPAPLQALSAISAAFTAPLLEGAKVEARAFGELAVTPVSRALVSIFFATQDLKKDAGPAGDAEARDVRKLGVLGAGLMGAGIAAAAADAGVAVRLRDTTSEALARGLRHVHDVFAERQRRGRLSGRQVAQRLERISATVDTRGFRRAELVIEAVFEDLALKRRVLDELESVAAPTCVFASNTSSLPIADIAAQARRPERVLGMHFFSPVHRMPLLEVIVTPHTAADAVATAVAFGRRLGKHVIVVGDGPGFYTTRVISWYLCEAARVLEQGAAIEDVERALLAFGFPVGPVALLDEVGIDVGAKVAGVLHAHFGARMQPPASLPRVLEDDRLGRKNKRGFYLYDGRKKRVDPAVYALLEGGPARRPVEARDIQDRLVFAFLNEAVHCLQEGILRSARDGDVGAIFGLGFPPFLGGPFRYLDHLGARFAVEMLERLEQRHGPRFRPAALLVDMARQERSFHG